MRLSEFFYSCDKNDTNFSIAKVLISKIQEFPDIFIEEIAYLAQTTPASVSKFCKRLGYHDFKTMRTDLKPIVSYSVFTDINKDPQLTDVQQKFERFLFEERNFSVYVFNKLDVGQLERIAALLRGKKKVAFLTNRYAFGIANLFRDLLSLYKITVLEVDRDANDWVIESVVKDVDLTFVITLTGVWLETKRELLSELSVKHNLVLTTFGKPLPTDEDFFHEVISLQQFNDELSSNVLSFRVLQIVFVLIFLQMESLHH